MVVVIFVGGAGVSDGVGDIAGIAVCVWSVVAIVVIMTVVVVVIPIVVILVAVLLSCCCCYYIVLTPILFLRTFFQSQTINFSDHKTIFGGNS